MLLIYFTKKKLLFFHVSWNNYHKQISKDNYNRNIITATKLKIKTNISNITNKNRKISYEYRLKQANITYYITVKALKISNTYRQYQFSW